MASANALELMPKPMCLVENTKDGKLVVQEETVEIISKMKEPMVVVAIVGTYRTGKSFLMNRLMERNNGFALGATIESKTKGIWAWCRRHPKRPDWNMLLLDTEGLGDIKKGDANNDNWIFALSVLLSCTLVYNWQCSLQADALGKLHILTELIKSKSNQVEEGEDEVEFIKFFPNFVWVLRDFTLTLETDGKPITADQYLRDALNLKKGISKSAMEYNHPRRCIETYFKEKKCFVLKRPVDKDELFSKLETLQDSELQEEFLQEAQNFCEYIFSSAMPKSFEGRQLNGSNICLLLQMFVEAIQSGHIPCVEDAVKTVTQIENGKAVKKAIAHYKDRMTKSLQLPTSLDELLSQNGPSSEEAMKIFMSESITEDKHQHAIELQMLLQEEFQNIVKENAAASKTFCNKLLNSLCQDLDQKVTDGLYSTQGGNKKYCEDKDNVILLYQNTPRKGVMAEETLHDRFICWKSRDALIMAADTALSEAERKAAEAKFIYELEKQQKVAAENMLAQKEQMIKDMEEGHKKNVEIMQQKMQQEKQQLIEEMERIIQQKIEEKRAAEDKGLMMIVEEKDEIIAKLTKELEAVRNKDGEPSFFDNVYAVSRAAITVLMSLLEK